MSENAEETTLNQLTLLQADFLVSRTALQEDDEEKVTSVTCGESSPELLANLNQDGSWVKMYWGYYQATMEGSLEEFSETWPRAGMMQHGECLRLEPLALPTYENEFISLPTVTANESKGSGKNRYVGSPHFRGAKMSEGLRICESDPIYLNPSFAERAMGFPLEWTLLVMP